MLAFVNTQLKDIDSHEERGNGHKRERKIKLRIDVTKCININSVTNDREGEDDTEKLRVNDRILLIFEKTSKQKNQ